MSDDDNNEDTTPVSMRLSDNTLIDFKTGKRVVPTEINKAFSDKPETSILSRARKAPKIEGVTRRFLDDLPVAAPQSRAISIIAAYSIFGLAEIDIAHILGIDPSIVEQVQESEGYAKFVDAMLQNIREHDQDKVRKRINNAAQRAAQRITNLMESTDEKVALSASKDVLDRASSNGDTALRNSGGALTIRIVDDRANPLDKIKVDIDG